MCYKFLNIGDRKSAGKGGNHMKNNNVPFFNRFFFKFITEVFVLKRL